MQELIVVSVAIVAAIFLSQLFRLWRYFPSVQERLVRSAERVLAVRQRITLMESLLARLKVELAPGELLTSSELTQTTAIFSQLHFLLERTRRDCQYIQRTIDLAVGSSDILVQIRRRALREELPACVQQCRQIQAGIENNERLMSQVS
jgi:hypothetical protein